jgi:2-keto-4-pentenoate hydratase/2-oxohepta-3-ene-1,7-dioic acid hydratase in catechol pathway
VFALGTFASGDRVFPGVVVGDRVRDLSSEYPSTLDILEGWDESLPRLTALADPGGADLELDSLQVLPPVTPRQILQSGANYRKHVIDLVVAQGQHTREEAEAIMDARAASGEPYIFFGTVSSLCGSYDDVVLPRIGTEHDWELELCAVIGRAARDVSPDDALDYVAGYTISNDLTTRDLVFRKDVGAMGADWVSSKAAPTFLPTGPFIVPQRFVGDPGNLNIRLALNGRVMQDESTADMIFDVAHLVSYASTRVQLLPGDLLLTGSPAGNGAHWGRFLRAGDVMEGQITGLGQQRNRCVSMPG